MVESDPFLQHLDIPELLQWARDHGTDLDERVEVYRDSITGLSFRASENIPAEVSIVNSSSWTVLSYLNATECLGYSRHGSPEFSSKFIAGLNEEYPHIIGHFFLIQQYRLGEKSFWWPYIRILPQPSSPDLPTPMWWSDDDLRFLEATNAAPAVQRMKEFWKSDYQRGITLLDDETALDSDYTLDLYKWAATIFGTRSFRPSLTMSCKHTDDYGPDPTDGPQQAAIEHVKTDRFSILLPVVDIGNHNGRREVEWKVSNTGSGFSISTTKQIEKRHQIYVFYGSKSNSELLAGYGFILPDAKADTVNLKISPPARDPKTPSDVLDPLTVRRSQNCHAAFQEGRRPEEEWMYTVSTPPDNWSMKSMYYELLCFSHGLIDTLICMSANPSELKYLADRPQLCMEDGSSQVYMCRNYISALLAVYDKLDHDSKKIRTIRTTLGLSRNSNQELALEYRNRQALTLEAAMEPLRSALQSLLGYNVFCEHPHHSRPEDKLDHVRRDRSMQALSLDCAYSWLGKACGTIYRPFCAFVRELEEEPTEIPRWDLLAANGWANVYWTAWVFIAYNLLDGGMIVDSECKASDWLRSAFTVKYAIFDSHSYDPREYGDSQENEAIDEIIEFILNLDEFAHVAEDEPRLQKLKDFSKWTAWTQTLEPKPFDSEHDSAAAPTTEGPFTRNFLCIAL